MSLEIYGKNPAIEAIEGTRKIYKVKIQEGFHHPILDKIKEKNIPIEVLKKNVFNQQYPSQSQGIVLEVEDYQMVELEKIISDLDLSKNPTILMLDGITDPHNLGAIIRSAEAGGIEVIIIPKDRSVKINATVVKTSVGAIEYVKVAMVVNLNQTVEKLKKAGFWIVGTTLQNAVSYEEIYVDRPTCLIIGSEGKGMKQSLMNLTDLNVKIPMAGKINSLNASVSAGILIFDILRRKRG